MKTISDKEFIKLFNSTSEVELAKKLGVSTRVIHYWAKKLGLTKRKLNIISKNNNK